MPSSRAAGLSGPPRARHDPARAGVQRPRGRRGYTGKQKPSRRWVIVNGSADHIPDRGMVLPFVDHDRCWGRRQSGRISLHEFERRWIGEIEKRGSPPPGCAGFPNALGALDGNGGEATKKFTERAVHDPMQVVWGEACSLRYLFTIPYASFGTLGQEPGEPQQTPTPFQAPSLRRALKRGCRLNVVSSIAVPSLARSYTHVYILSRRDIRLPSRISPRLPS
jgi:hypothetical protein